MTSVKIHVSVALALLGLWALGGTARAQAPEFKQEFAKSEEVKRVVWKASASAGFSISTGNASVMTLSGGASASRNDGKNKISLVVNATLARSLRVERCPSMGLTNPALRL